MTTRCALFRDDRNRNPRSPSLTTNRFSDALKHIAGIAFLLAMTARPSFGQINVTVNYGDAVNSNASPLIFGGANEPNPGDDASFYPQAAAAGIKFERCVIHVDQVVPSGITLAEFQADSNGVANPNNWNWGPISGCIDAHAQGWTVMANLTNAPAWLTYNGSVLGVPTNWDVWQQIVIGIVQKLGNNVNYVELLNEPNNFVNITGSPYSSVQQAVLPFYWYGAVGARYANGSVLIGGDGEASSTLFSTLEPIIEDTTITSNLLQFVTFHRYVTDPGADNYVPPLQSILSSHGRGGLPIFITEWNDNAEYGLVGNGIIPWVAEQLMTFSTQPGLSGTAYFSFLPGNEVVSGYEECGCGPGLNESFYDATNGVVTLEPKARVYQLLSQALGLGKGTFKVQSTSAASPAQGFTNSQGGAVAAVVNTGGSATTANVTLNNINASGCGFTVYYYWADAGNDTAVDPVSSATNQCVTNGTMTLNGLGVPAYGVLGLTVTGSGSGGGGGTGTGTAITPYLQVNAAAWQETNVATVAAGSTVNLGPQPVGGTWAWTGPNGFTSNAREIDGIPLTAASETFVATYTNASGVKSTETFTITVTGLSGGGTGNLIANGTYVITSVHSGLALGDPNSSTANSAVMEQLAVTSGTNEQWTVNNLGNNVITLTNGASGQMLDVNGASVANGALVDQWPANGQNNQKWTVISLGGGHYELTSVNSGLALDVDGGVTTAGAEIDQYTYNGNSWQQWIFTAK